MHPWKPHHGGDRKAFSLGQSVDSQPWRGAGAASLGRKAGDLCPDVVFILHLLHIESGLEIVRPRVVTIKDEIFTLSFNNNFYFSRESQLHQSPAASHVCLEWPQPQVSPGQHLFPDPQVQCWNARPKECYIVPAPNHRGQSVATGRVGLDLTAASSVCPSG